MQGKTAAGNNIWHTITFLKKPIKIKIIISHYKFNIYIRKLRLDIRCVFLIQIRSPQIHPDRFFIFLFPALFPTA